MNIFWIVALIVVTNVSTFIVMRWWKNRTHKPELANSEQVGWSEGFDTGWTAALADYTAVKEAYLKLQSGPLR